MDKKALLDFAKGLGKLSLQYTIDNFESLNLNPKVAPFVKIALTILNSELSKTDGLASLHKFDVQ